MAYDPQTGLEFGGQTQDSAMAEFYNTAVQNNFKSEQEGRPIFEDRVFIRIRTPGDRHTEVDREIKEQDKHRFALQWARFQQQESQTQEGTPLEEWPAMTPALVRSFKALNVFSVEALAAVSDGNLQNLGVGARNWRDKAVSYLANAKDSAFASKMQAENADLRAQIETMQANFNDLAAKVSARSKDDE